MSLDEQLTQWEERKAQEKPRHSVVDDVPTAQPALALACKVIQRVTKAGFPVDLLPADITSITVTADADAEDDLRTAVLVFMDTLRAVEKAVTAERRAAALLAELDTAPVGSITEDEWRACWTASDVERAEPQSPEEAEFGEADRERPLC